MRMVLRIGIALLVLAVLLLGALAVALPRIAASEAVRTRLQAAAREATGQEVSWQTLSFGLLPPRLVVVEPQVAAPGKSAEPLARAESVDLRLALLPLVARTVVIDSLVVEGVALRLVRTAQGVELPGASAPGAPKKPSEPAEAGAGVALAVRELDVRRAQLQLEDRTVSPPVTWRLDDFEARARGSSLDGPIDVTLSGRLASGGGLRVSGTARLDGPIDLVARLDQVALAPVAPYLGKGQRLAGSLSGQVKAKGPPASPTDVDADLLLTDADVKLEDVAVRGRLSVKANLAGGVESPSGSFEVDATQAELAYGSAFTKPSGTAATASGRLVPQPGGGLGVDEVKLKIRNLDATGQVRTRPRTRVELDAPRFDLDGWGALVPALAEMQPAGGVALEKLVLATEPLEVRGAIRIDGLRVRPAGQQALVVNGVLQGTGNALRGEALQVGVDGVTTQVDVEVAELATRPRYRVRARAEKVEANTLVTALAGRKDTLYGPLSFDANVAGPLGDERSPLETLGGRTRLDLDKGRLRGVSLLETTFQRLGSFGEAALLAGALRGGKTLQRFYGDEFESISGTFDLGGGKARTEDLRLVYRHYSADLRGSLGLADGSLDLTGTLTISQEVDAALAGAAETGSVEQPAPEPRRKVIPLARVRGTITNPRPDLSPEAVLAFATSFAVSRRRQKVEGAIDERLGEGAGRQILEGLEGILGGGKRKSQ